MRILRNISFGFAVALAASELARWTGDIRLVPMAFDELVVAAALFAAAWIAPRAGAPPLAAAWGLFCGLMLGLLVPTLDHLLFGPPKAGALFYSIVLGAALLGGAWATVAATKTAFAAARQG